MILQILISGLLVPLLKYIYSKGIDPLNFSYQIMLAASFILYSYSFASGRKTVLIINRKQLLYLIIIGIISGALAYSFFSIGLKYRSVVNCTFLMQSSVFFIPVLGHFFLNEKLGLYKISLISALLAGLYLTVTSGEIIIPQIGDLLILASAASFSIGIIMSKIILREVSAITFSLYRSLFGSISLFIFLIITGLIKSEINWLWIILTGFIISLGLISAGKVLEKSSVSYLSMMGMSVPVVTAVIAYLFLNESMGFLQIMGGAVIILSGFLVHRTGV